MAVNIPPMQGLLVVPGVRLGAAYAGIKAATVGVLGVPDQPASNDASATSKEPAPDTTIVLFDSGTTMAGVFTQNRFSAAPVQLCQELLGSATVSAWLINSGNANAATGDAGKADARELQQALSEQIGGGAVMPFSTGVIGERLPVAAMRAALPACLAAATDDGWAAAATAIMTTDTCPKAVSVQGLVGDAKVTVTGMAKGSGMIRPDMATLLSYLCCDAQVPYPLLQTLCREVADASFNRLTVDGDTSTNDCFVIAATSKSTLVDDAQSLEYQQLKALLTDVGAELAQRIVRDGEGATKFVTVTTEGAKSEADALAVSFTVAHSPLVKTALFASDPNWGRVCMAMGRAGVEFEQSDVAVYFDDLCVVRSGVVHEAYTEALGAAVLAQDEIKLRMVIGSGPAGADVWTSDFSYDYVRINAEYRS